MLHAGLDLSRKKVDVRLLSEAGEHLDQLATPPDADALRTLARRIEETHREPVCAVIESMTGARLVHDTLKRLDAVLVEGLAGILAALHVRLAPPKRLRFRFAVSGKALNVGIQEIEDCSEVTGVAECDLHVLLRHRPRSISRSRGTRPGSGARQ